MTRPASSTQPTIRPFRLALKTILIFLVLNFIYGAIFASPAWFLVINRGTYQRFPVLWVPDVHNDGSVSLERELFSDMDLLFASHILTREKSPDEFRVFIFGDSSVWGTSLYPQETLAGQITRMNLLTCSGKRIVTYNLGYPSNSATKDLVFMQHARPFQPDLVVWLFSMLAFQDIRQDVPFVIENPSAVRELIDQYGLTHDLTGTVPNRFWDGTLIGERQRLNLLMHLQASSLLVDAMGMDDPRISSEHSIHFTDAPKDENDFFGIEPPADLKDYLALDTLRVANDITQGKILYVGEPIEISTGEYSQVSYNSVFPRWAYDQFRQIVQEMSFHQGWDYLDLWNLVPEDQFTTSIFHLSPQGESALAERVGEAIQRTTCP